MLKIIFNGAELSIAEGTTLRALLEQQKLNSPHLVIDWNDDIVTLEAAPRLDSPVNAGDKINVFSMVGGG